MAIRFKHQVGAGIIGAFATGHANAQNRRRKYALDMMQQEREHQMRMQERIAPYKYRAALGGGRGGGRGGVEPAGMWIDPAADTTLTEDEKIKLRVKQNAQRRAAARAMRMGRAPTATDALPWFKSQAAIDAEKQADAAFIKREQEIEDERRAQAGREKLATMGQEADAAAERLAGQQALAKERMKAIEADIGNGRYSPDDAKLLRAKQRDIQQTLLSGRFTDEDQRQEELDRLRAERDEIIDRKLPEETVGDKYGKGVH